MKTEDTVRSLIENNTPQPILFMLLACEKDEWHEIPETQDLRRELIALLAGEADTSQFKTVLATTMHKLDNDVMTIDRFPTPEMFQDWRGPTAFICAVAIAAFSCAPEIRMASGGKTTDVATTILTRSRVALPDMDATAEEALLLYMSDVDVQREASPRPIRLHFVEK